MALVPYYQNRKRTAPGPPAHQCWFHGHTYNKLEDDEVEILSTPNLQPAQLSPGWKPQEAIRYLIKSIELDKSELLGKFRSQREMPHRFPYALFCDLDDAIFGSVLRGNVHLRLDGNPENGLCGMTTRPCEEGRRITIELSRDVVFKQSSWTILEALVHQMLHAYLLQCCGTEDEKCGFALRHGLEFSTAAMAVVSACKMSAFMNFPALVGILAPCRRRTNRGSPISHSAEKDRSHCASQGVPSRQCLHFYELARHGVEVPVIDLDRKCPKDKEGTRR